jgi:hypothetical protein
VHVFENNGVPVNGWVAEIHLGVRKTNLVEVGTTIPPVDTLPILNITVGGDGYETVNVELKPKA